MLKTMIIDDDPIALKILKTNLKKTCPEVELMGEYLDVNNAMNRINRECPDLVFIKIENTQLNGFDFLNSIVEINFEVIFITKFPEFAVKAFRMNAADFLLKPILDINLIDAVKKVAAKQQLTINQLQNIEIRQMDQLKRSFNKIPLTYNDCIEFVCAKQVLYCKSEGSYTHVVMQNKKALVTKQLGMMEDLLPAHDFLRTHRSYIVNLSHVKKYFRNDGGYLQMSNGDKVDVSRRKKEQFMCLF